MIGAIDSNPKYSNHLMLLCDQICEDKIMVEVAASLNNQFWDSFFPHMLTTKWVWGVFSINMHSIQETIHSFDFMLIIM